ncbi:unnamed protein product, partial [Sphenostylis stenocarpa]
MILVFFLDGLILGFSWIPNSIFNFSKKSTPLIPQSKKKTFSLLPHQFTCKWICGAMVARLTPDQKVACSIHV